ncbi:MAG: FAD-binding oxidoreductase [Intrasporangiaceae bacterium]|nr:FAD-binding oxidoreductase [Intrasporangiaceae bacterium]
MRRVESVAVVGAGMVGLATAWHLQEHGVEVTVLDRTGVAAGASWGNAGWLTPALVAPLPEPALLRYGIRAVISPRSPVYAPLAADRDLARFMTGFLRHSTHRRWERALRTLLPLVREALPAFDQLAAEGVSAPTLTAGPIVAAFPRASQVGGLTDELERVAAVGGAVDYELVSGLVARRLVSILSGSVEAAVLIRGQRFINPVTYVHTLANSVRSRGGELITGSAVTGLADASEGVRVTASDGGDGRYDAVVVATGAWLGRLARPFGVRSVVQAGRGYSFSVAADPAPRLPVYLPTARVAVTPLGNRVRIAGMMELRRPGAALDPRRIRAIVDSVRPLLHGVDLDSRADEWVGSRPVTVDGLPLIGATSSPRVFVAGGHGMWGITLGPVSGRLLAEQVVTGRAPDALRPFDPLR